MTGLNQNVYYEKTVFNGPRLIILTLKPLLNSGFLLKVEKSIPGKDHQDEYLKYLNSTTT